MLALRMSRRPARTPTADPLAVRLAVAIKRLRGRFREAAWAGGVALPIAQVAVLKRLRNDGPTTVSALAAAEQVTHQAMAQTLRGLQRAGLVRSAAHPRDGRKRVISVTARGHHVFESAVASRDAWLARAIETLVSPARARRAGEVRGVARAPGGHAGAAAVMTRTFQALAGRNFRLFFIGQLISNTGNQLTNLALILFALKLGHRGLAVGALAACQFGPLVVLSTWAGAVADRTDKRRALLLTQSLEMAQSGALALLAFLPHPSLGVLYALALAGGILLAFDNPLRRSFVPEMVSKDDLPNAVVLYSTNVALAQVAGPALAGVLVTTVGFGWCFTLDAATFLAVIGCLAAMRERELFRQPPSARTGREVREGFAYVASVPRLWIGFAMFGLVGLFTFNLRVALPLFVTRTLRGSAGAFAAIYAVMSTGAVAGTLVIAHKRLVTLSHVIGATVALGGCPAAAVVHAVGACHRAGGLPGGGGEHGLHDRVHDHRPGRHAAGHARAGPGGADGVDRPDGAAGRSAGRTAGRRGGRAHAHRDGRRGLSRRGRPGRARAPALPGNAGPPTSR